MVDVSRAYPSDRVILREVGLRDGLQLTRSWPSTGQKIDWIDREYKAGVRYFEAGSYLPVDKAPRFADVNDVVAAIGGHRDAHGIALALNRRGASDALATDVPEVTVVISASPAHNAVNVRRTQEQSLTDIKAIVGLRDEMAKETIVSVGIAMAFGCSIAGPIGGDAVLRLVDRCMDAGVDTVGIADTVGYAGPRQVAQLCSRMAERFTDAPYSIHLHDTRGMAIANAAAALDCGCRVLDASLAGLGGCPYAPGATGNVVMEDLVYLCETMGFPTGIDIEDLIATRAVLAEAIPNERLAGALAQAAPPKLWNWRASAA